MYKLQPWLALCQHLHLVRGHRIVLQDDLARLYGTDFQRIAALAGQFPGDLCFTLEPPELIRCDEESSPRENVPVYGFTEHGALALAYALNSPAAVAMSVPLVRAFVAARQAGFARRFVACAAPAA